MFCFQSRDAARNAEAIEHFTLAIKADPLLVKSYNARGTAYVRALVGETAQKTVGDKSRDDLAKGVPLALDLKSDLAQRMLSKARADFEKALELNPDYGPAKENLEALRREEILKALSCEF